MAAMDPMGMPLGGRHDYGDVSFFPHDPMTPYAPQYVQQNNTGHTPPDSLIGQDASPAGDCFFNGAGFQPLPNAGFKSHNNSFSSTYSNPPPPYHHPQNHPAQAWHPQGPAFMTPPMDAHATTALWVTGQQQLQCDPSTPMGPFVSTPHAFDSMPPQFSSPVPFHQQQQQQPHPQPQNFQAQQQQQLSYVYQQPMDQPHFSFAYTPPDSTVHSPTGINFQPQYQQGSIDHRNSSSSFESVPSLKREHSGGERRDSQQPSTKRQKKNSKDLTEAEKRDLNLRRNREAASKCREKKKCRDDLTHVKCQIFETKNAELRAEREQLQQQMNSLRDALVNSAAAGSNHPDVREWISKQSKAEEMKRMRHLGSDWAETDKVRALREKLHHTKGPGRRSRSQSVTDLPASPDAFDDDDDLDA